ncbi:MAG: VOC family protein [Candidatus Sulfotelmatobacter sp.]
MPKRSLDPGNNDTKKIEQLHEALESMFARTDGKVGKAEPGVQPLVRIAADLRDLPRDSFKTRLKSELEGRKSMSTVAEPVAAVRTVASPRLTFKDAAKAIEFYKQAFGATETFRFEVGGGIPHAEIKIGDSVIMLTEEWPEGRRFSPETLGYSPVSVSLTVGDADSFAARAVAAGAKLTAPIRDQFYGHREGTVIDPFGYTWGISMLKEEMSVEEMHRRMKGMTKGPEGGEMPAAKKGVSPIPSGYRTVTPYLVAQDANAVIDFVKKTFGGEELFRAVGSAGGYHCEVRVEDSMLMIGGGGEGVAWKGESKLGAFHVYVRDCDATYQRALQAGGKSLAEPADQAYGERSASVIDAAGNHWYIATRKVGNYKREGAPTIQPSLHPLRVEPVVNFLKGAFDAEETGRHTAPDGVVHHLTIKVGDSYLEMGEAHGPYQPMKSMFYLYVPNVDAVYSTAIAAGAKSMKEPADQPYGDRVGAVTDNFGNQWWIATHVKDVADKV